MKENEFEQLVDEWGKFYWEKIRIVIDDDLQDDWYVDWWKELKEEMIDCFKKWGDKK